MADSPPTIVRPIPRRPYSINSFEQISSPPSPSQTLQDGDFFNAPNPAKAYNSNNGVETPSYLRTASSINLTSSTLFGIYGNEPDTPTALSSRRQSPDPSLHNLASPLGGGRTLGRVPLSHTAENPRVSSIILHRRLSCQQRSSKPDKKISAKNKAWQFAWRLGLLYAFGVCYGLLIYHLQNEGAMKGMHVKDIMRNARIEEGYSWRYLTFWGFAGVSLGSLLPWIERLWEEKHPGSTSHIDRKDEAVSAKNNISRLAADWNPIVRSMGVFVGIAFAIRKLAWTSTLQLSLTLSLVNPVLWYLVDRTLPGALLSLLTSTTGTILLLFLNPSMSIMPPPLSLSTSPPPNFTISFLTSESASASSNHSRAGGWYWAMMAREGVLDYAQFFEIAVWIGSVLFCSAVCFGGIGRKLALRRST